MECLACEKNFFLSDGECFKGFVHNCNEFLEGSGNNCKTCEEGYSIIHMNRYDYCYPLVADLTCSSATLSNSAEFGGLFTCGKCLHPNQKIT